MLAVALEWTHDRLWKFENAKDLLLSNIFTVYFVANSVYKNKIN